MSWYRKIDVRMHGDKRFRRLSDSQPSGKYLWIYLLTGPHTSDGLPGLYPVGRADLASRLKWPLADFDCAWNEVSAVNDDAELPMAMADWECHVVWIPNSIRYNAPESPNVVRGWQRPFDLIPECDLRQAWVMNARSELECVGPSHIKAFDEGFTEAFAEGLPEAFAKGWRHPIANTQTQTQTQPQEEGAPKLPLEVSPTIIVPKLKSHDPLKQIVIMMPVKTGERPITLSEVMEWETLYGNIDVRATLRKMRGHWDSKPVSHRKTMRGIKTSINTWLAKDSDRGGSGASNLGAPRHSNRERNEKIMNESLRKE